MRLGKLVLAASCIAAFSSSAEGAGLRFSPRVDLHGTVGEMVDQLGRGRGGPHQGRGRRHDGSVFLFPSAGSVQGAGGTFFRSDVTIVNHRNTVQPISVGWIAQGVNNGSRALQYFDLNAVTPVRSRRTSSRHDLHQSGLGAVLVTGVTTTGSPDSNATLDGFSRIWTNQTGRAGHRLARVPVYLGLRLARQRVRLRASVCATTPATAATSAS